MKPVALLVAGLTGAPTARAKKMTLKNFPAHLTVKKE